MVEEVERSKDDSRRMFQVVKDLQKRKEKKRIVVDGEDGKTTDEKEQIRLVTAFLNDMFSKEDEEIINLIEPEKMKTPFTKEESVSSKKSEKWKKCRDR